MEKIYLDENGNFEFDFSKAEDVIITGKLSHCIPGFQYNVDFIIVGKDIIFLEFKNSKIKNVTDTHSFQNKLTRERNKFCQNIAMKFTSSLFWLWACKGNEEEKNIYYYLLIENDYMDARMRKAFRNKISRQLPHNYESYSNIKRKIISGFQITSLEEWNTEFPQYIIKLIT